MAVREKKGGRRLKVENRPNGKISIPGPDYQTRRPPPDPLPAGVMPDEMSPLWYFTNKANRLGERHILDDTRDWFRDRGFSVQICRSYPDHPRWQVRKPRGESLQVDLANNEIVAEIHMLARIHAKLPDMPDWVAKRVAVKHLQSGLAYEILNGIGRSWRKYGQEALDTLAQHKPAQFIKIATTMLPRTTIHETAPPVQSTEVINEPARMVEEELTRRQNDHAAVHASAVIDYETMGDVTDAFKDVADKLNAASGVEGAQRISQRDTLLNPRRVRDLADDAVELDENGEVKW